MGEAGDRVFASAGAGSSRVGGRGASSDEPRPTAGGAAAGRSGENVPLTGGSTRSPLPRLIGSLLLTASTVPVPESSPSGWRKSRKGNDLRKRPCRPSAHPSPVKK